MHDDVEGELLSPRYYLTRSGWPLASSSKRKVGASTNLIPSTITHFRGGVIIVSTACSYLLANSISVKSRQDAPSDSSDILSDRNPQSCKMVLLSTYISTGLAGVFSHVAYFKRGEHHLYGVLYIKVFFGTIIAATAALSYARDIAWTIALTTVCRLMGSYLLGLYSSLLVYRIFLHPLHKFPGPFSARISSAWMSTQLKNNNLHIKLLELHRKYGPFVRIGSSDLSVMHPHAIEVVYGSKSRCIKGIYYDLSWPSSSLQLMRDPEQHHARRRVWSGAFSDKLLRGYEQRIRGYRQKLVDRFTEMSDQPINVKKWFNLYSFDVMGDLSFGRGFGSLERKEEHSIIRLLNSSLDFIGLYLPAWAFILIAAIPGLSGGFWEFLDYCGEMLMERLKEKAEVPDISSSFCASLGDRSISEITAEEKNLLYADTRLIVVAGSDTTSGTLSTIFYELLRHPEEIEKLRAELAPFVDKEDPNNEFLHSKIAHLDHLNGVINEALRLYPVVPSGLQRKTPQEGIVVDGVHIPGETHVYCPEYALGRLDSVYARPEEFIPERWYKWPELIRDKTAFAPFSIGPFNCIGRPVALMNLRTTVARLITEFDIRFAPGEDGSQFLNNAKDNFVFYSGDLNMVFSRRD
ncbi:cytochrome P450 [Aspergillus lucknowensis]|uniref:Cytochrome P450 n=1 Tax=Aspergillus lucknowensis TaxID=176173 RepID=A0ABR4LBD5_9EURO